MLQKDPTADSHVTELHFPASTAAFVYPEVLFDILLSHYSNKKVANSSFLLIKNIHCKTKCLGRLFGDSQPLRFDLHITQRDPER